MKRYTAGIILILLLLGATLYGQAKLNLFNPPCTQPINYSLGTFDERFGLTQEEFLSEAERAVAVWENEANLDLFAYDPSGSLKLNLIYDYRQEATDRLKNLGVVIDDTQGSYDSLKVRFDKMTLDYEILKSDLEAQVEAYNRDKQAYEEQVRYWNSQGGAPSNVLNQLNSQRNSLNARADRINRDQDTLNELAASINAMVDVLNRMAKNLNITVSNYNNVGSSRGEEFEAGVYIESGRSRMINIYEFTNKEKLLRLLAHEFGHALGMDHLDSNPEAIMYRLNSSINFKPAPEDLAELRSVCKLD